MANGGEGDHAPSHVAEAETKGDGKAAAEEAEVPPVGPLEVFKYADRCDVAMMVIGALAAFANGAGLPAFSLLFGDILNELAFPGADVEAAVRRLALIMTGVGAAVFVLSTLQVGLWMTAAMRQVDRVRRRFFLSALRQDMAWHDEHKPGALTAMMDGDTRVIMNGTNDKLSNGIFQLGMALFGYGIGFFRTWELTLVMLGTLPFIAGVGALMSIVMTRLMDRSREGYAKAGEIATELLENVRTVQVFGQEDSDVARFTAALQPASTASIKREFASSASVGLTYFVLFSSYAIAFWFASFLIVNGRSNVGDVTATFFAVLMGSFGVGLLFPSVAAFAEARGAARKVYGVIDRVPPIDVFAGGSQLGPLRQALVLRDVSFRYPTRRDQPLLNHFDVVIPRGQRVAFSGASGCGKSTVISLLQRYYDPDSGVVEVDGVDLRTVDLKWWRDRIGVVSQEPALIMGTIEENVKIGKPDATHEEVVDACQKAQIHDVIMALSEGYDTSVGAVGSQLSGGQKQRIAIARAIIRKPEILILDEATSALDRKSEMEVQRTLDSVMRSGSGEALTVVVIAHRLATIRGVDRIFFMETDGERGSSIAESGSFGELMAQNGKFAAMAARQAAAAREDASDEPEEGERAGTAAVPAELLEKTEKKESERAADDTAVPWLRVLRMTAPNAGYTLLGLLGSVVAGGLYPAYAVVLTKMLDALTRTADADDIRANTAIWAPMFVAIGVAALIGWTLHGMYAVAGERLTTKLRQMLLSAALRQEQAYFDTPGQDAGALAGILSGDAEAVHQLWGASLGFKVQSVCNLVAGVVIALIYNWRIALVVLATAPLIVLAGALQQVLLVGFGHQGKESSGDSIKSEAFSNIRTVTAFNLQEERYEKYNRLTGDASKKHFGTGLVTGLTFGLSQFALYGVFALAFWYGGRLLQRGQATFEEILIATMGVLMGAMGAGEAGGFAAKLADAQTASRRVFAIIDRKPLIDVDEGGLALPSATPTVALDDVAFRYPARPLMRVLRGVSEVYPFGNEVGIIGQTGCGKSTIIQLLARFYDPESGAVTVNGVDLRALDLRQWRAGVSLVMQEPALFNGSIRDNILYGRPDATEAEVMDAARLAAIHDDVLAMPQGYDTSVGYRGRELSGGQKQRVAIARALLRRPRLLLLDEATSALDNATELRVQQGLAEFRKQYAMTTVSVAHRLTTIERSDVIMVMDRGQVIERGNHNQLIALGGEYKVRHDLYHGTA